MKLRTLDLLITMRVLALRKKALRRRLWMVALDHLGFLRSLESGVASRGGLDGMVFKSFNVVQKAAKVVTK